MTEPSPDPPPLDPRHALRVELLDHARWLGETRRGFDARREAIRRFERFDEGASASKMISLFTEVLAKNVDVLRREIERQSRLLADAAFEDALRDAPELPDDAAKS